MAVPGKYFIYARKSTDVEDKQVRSIDAQLSELRAIAQRDGLFVVAELVEKQSAKAPGRPVFNSMLNSIQHGEANAILAWHPDRLARNMTDGGRIIDLVDTEKIAALRFPTFWFDTTPQGKFMLSMAFSQSKYYVDALAENTKRGYREKIRRGEYPGIAPLGYLNDPRIKRIVIDRERAPVVVELFEEFATGKVTIEGLRDFLRKRGIQSQTGRPKSNEFITRILKNPIYYGHFRYAGDIHEGVHDAILTKALFDRVQEVFARRWRYTRPKPASVAKPFLDLFRCSQCGMSITGEVQKGCTYYRCTKKNKAIKCSQPYIREDALSPQLSRLLSRYSLRSDWAEQMLQKLQAEQVDATRLTEERAVVIRREIERLKGKTSRLLEMRLDGEIEASTHLKKKATMMAEKKSLDEELANLDQTRHTRIELFRNWISEATNLGETIDNGTLDDQATAARKIFGSNLFLDRKRARGEAVKPWAFLAVNGLSDDMVPRTRIELVTLPSSGECSTN